jgi:hypothetical protein
VLVLQVRSPPHCVRLQLLLPWLLLLLLLLLQVVVISSVVDPAYSSMLQHISEVSLVGLDTEQGISNKPLVAVIALFVPGVGSSGGPGEATPHLVTPCHT